MTALADTGLLISKSKARSPLARAAGASGFTLPALAARVSEVVGRTVNASTLKMAAPQLTGTSRPIKRDVAEAIQRLTMSEDWPHGLAATRANWPNLQD